MDIMQLIKMAKRYEGRIGTTEERPIIDDRFIGMIYFDTDLAENGKPIWWTGTTWVDACGVEV